MRCGVITAWLSKLAFVLTYPLSKLHVAQNCPAPNFHTHIRQGEGRYMLYPLLPYGSINFTHHGNNPRHCGSWHNDCGYCHGWSKSLRQEPQILECRAVLAPT